MVMYWANEKNNLVAVSVVEPIDCNIQTEIYEIGNQLGSIASFDSDSQNDFMEQISNFADGEWILCSGLMNALRIAGYYSEFEPVNSIRISFVRVDDLVSMCVSGWKNKVFFYADCLAEALDILYDAVNEFGWDIDEWPTEKYEFDRYWPNFNGVTAVV